MLTLVGAGLGPDSVSQSLRKALERANLIVVETYTSPGSGWVEELVKGLGKDVLVASRDVLEERSRDIVELAASRDVVIVVPGDPMIATTHSSLVVEALRSGVRAQVIPGLSGPCASMSVSGLQFYRFGRKMTIPAPWRGVGYTSIAYWFLGNLCLDLHTLFLLDVSPSGEQLAPREGVRALKEALNDLLGASWSGLRDLIVLEVSVGDDGIESSYATLSDYDRLSTLVPSSLMVPARLHVSEIEFLTSFHGVPDELIRAHQLALSRLDACELFFRTKERVMSEDRASS